MHVFYNPSGNSPLPGGESHHAVKVLRLSAGSEILIIDGKGSFFTAVITHADPKSCTYNVIETIDRSSDRSLRIHIAFGVIKASDRMEWFIEKATEIGIDEISPLHCERSERKKINLERFEKTAITALKQSQQAFMPVINPVVTFNEFIGSHIPGYIAHCYEGMRMPLKEFDKSENSVTVLIGPEGDFTPAEIEMAVSVGWKPVSLGESRLRAETAALVALHSIHLLKDY